MLSAIFPFGLFTNRISLSTQTESKQELVTVPKRAKQIIDAKVELDKLNTLSKYFDYYLLNNIHKHSKYIIDTFCSDFEKVEHEHKLNVVNLVQFNYYYTEHINDFLSELKVSIKTNRTNFNSELNIKEDKLTEYKKELKEKNTRGLKTKIKNIEKDIKTLNSNIENIVYNTINSNKEMLQKYLEKIENFNVNPNSDNKLKDSKNSLNYIINNEMLKI